MSRNSRFCRDEDHGYWADRMSCLRSTRANTPGERDQPTDEAAEPAAEDQDGNR